MKKRHVSESLCLKKTNVTKRSRGRHAAKMLLGRKHANFWRTSDCGEKHDVATLEYLMTSRVCCVLRCGFCYLYIYIYAAIFSCQAECFFVLSVSILDLFAGRSCSRQHYRIETRTVSSKECQSNPYIYVLFVSIRTLLACRSLSRYSGSVR